jgi:hypothetical protein
MQMGRWFGFRRGYRDLVRLFIGRSEGTGRRVVDLYEAFKWICLDEEKFREDLRRYSMMREPRITPRDIPPLVPSHILRPTSRNKMYNARLLAVNWGGKWVERTMAPTESAAIARNALATSEIVSGLQSCQVSVRIKDYLPRIAFPAYVGRIAREAANQFFAAYEWSTHEAAAQWSAVQEFAEGLLGDPEIDTYLLVLPQISEESVGTWEVGKAKYQIVRRSRADDGQAARYGAYSDPKHRRAAYWCANLVEGEARNAETKALQRPRQAVVLIYPCLDPVRERGNTIPSIGFCVAFPGNSISQEMVFTVQDPSQPDAVVVSKIARA